MLSGVKGTAADHTLAVFVDPYTGTVRGALEQYGSTGALPLRTWIDELHRDLHLGQTGRLYSELAASWLWVIAGGGLLLWFSRRRALRRVRGTSGRRRTLGCLHGTVGVWAAVGFIFLSATGLTWSTYAGANIDQLRTSLGQSTPRCRRRQAASTRGTAVPPRPATPNTAWDSTRSSPPRAPGAWATPSRSSRPPTRTPRTSSGRCSGAGRRSRTRSPSIRPPARSPTNSGSRTTRCSPN